MSSNLMLMSDAVRTGIAPAMALLPASMDSAAARVLLLTFGLQESRLMYRDQLEAGGKNTVLGPALGLWQFERAGGTLGVLMHGASAKMAQRVCSARGVSADSRHVWPQLATDDVLAAAFARLLMWTDPLALPGMDDADAAWRLYLRTWRPGAYERGTEAQRQVLRGKFDASHALAHSFVRGELLR